MLVRDTASWVTAIRDERDANRTESVKCFIWPSGGRPVTACRCSDPKELAPIPEEVRRNGWWRAALWGWLVWAIL